MKNVIVTTTINPPTEAIRKYDAMPNWDLIVVGDTKTPNYTLKRGRYISWEEQKEKYPYLCELIGERSVARGRMIAFIEGYRTGAEIIASIDDDNYPYVFWGKNIMLNKKIKVSCYYSEGALVFNPLRLFSYGLYHRGYPLQLRRDNHEVWDKQRVLIKPLIQAGLWDGDPDIDAIDRISKKPDVIFDSFDPYTTKAFSPVNTQNTFIHRSVIKDFPANIPFIGRADDIWASYLFQSKHPLSTVYGSASVYHRQVRTPESLINDLENEIFAYKHTYGFLQTLKNEGVELAKNKYLPARSREAIEIYESYFD